jgi:hypothetical protein
MSPDQGCERRLVALEVKAAKQFAIRELVGFMCRQDTPDVSQNKMSLAASHDLVPPHGGLLST